MVIALAHRQRIATLTPLEDVLQRIAHLKPAAPRHLAPTAALGAVLAQDVTVAAARPSAPLALIDGLAVSSDLTAAAEAYAPALLPALDDIAAGDVLTTGADAVAPLEAVRWRPGGAELPTPVAPGHGVLLTGTDAAAGEILWRAGHRLRASDIAVMQALGIAPAVVRKPRIAVVRARDGSDAILDAIVTFLVRAVAANGGEAVAPSPAPVADALAAALSANGADAAIVVGGSGAGPRDDSVHALRRTGDVAAHGIAISPGETAAVGTAFSRPVLVVPGRLDAALAVWLLIGRPLLAHLAGSAVDALPYPRREQPGVLTAKVTSTVGLTDVVPVRRDGSGVIPLASRYLPLATIAHACGVIVIPPASEGLAAGATVAVASLP
jgi:molybdopterin biosynthesis enzyme